MKEPLNYSTKVDWGASVLPTKYLRIYGLLVLLLICAYSWKFHKHNLPTIVQATMAALCLVAAAALAAAWTTKVKSSKFLISFMLIQLTAQTVALFNSW
jgi:hypothetical protein